jgi:hypothetical protein
MSSLQEKLERAEKTAHVSSKHVGLTIALIGVLIALCAAMAGSEQNELTRSMMEQTQANSDNSGASTKFRTVMVELEKLRHESSLGSVDAGFVPELKRLLRLYLDYSRERDFAKQWVDSYQPAVEAHFDAAQGYDNAQLFAEIAIVIASLAVLLSNRPAWLISIVLAVICIGMLTSEFLKTRHSVAHAVGNIRQAENAYQQVRKSHLGASGDERTLEELDPGGKIRAEIEKSSQR